MSMCDPYPYPRRGIARADVGEQEQHQQDAAARPHVRAPRREFARLVPIDAIGGKACIDVPAVVTGLIRMRETHHKRAPEARRRPQAPASFANDLVKRGMQHRRAFRLQERWVLVAGKPDHWFCPGSSIVGIAAGIAP
jgi:hypothetical protein